MDESRLVSLANEEIDYGNPPVTAKDVLDRDSLKAFVTQTGNHYIARLQAGGLEAGSKLRFALRDPNGPWWHGSLTSHFLAGVA